MHRLPGIALASAIALALALAAPAHASIFGPTTTPNTPVALAAKLHKPVSPALIAKLERASKAGLALKATPADMPLKAISGPRLGAGKKVTLLYIGADFCPYCAGERWGLMLTLLRFGKFSGLRYMLSSANDVHPNTPTVTFQHATYTSRYVDFQAVEISDRQRKRLAQPNKAQMKALMTFDAPPYAHFRGAIPFVYLDGHYLPKGLIVSPEWLSGRNWKQAAGMLANANGKLFQHVMPRVNLMTAAICKLDGNQPANVCMAPGVVAARAALPASTSAAH